MKSQFQFNSHRFFFCHSSKSSFEWNEPVFFSCVYHWWKETKYFVHVSRVKQQPWNCQSFDEGEKKSNQSTDNMFRIWRLVSSLCFFFVFYVRPEPLAKHASLKKTHGKKKQNKGVVIHIQWMTKVNESEIELDRDPVS